MGSVLSIGVGAYMLEPSGFGVSAVYRCSSLHVGAAVGVGAYMLEPSVLSIGVGAVGFGGRLWGQLWWSALGSALVVGFGVSWAVIVLLQPFGDTRYQRCHGVIYVKDVQDGEHEDSIDHHP